MNKNGEICRELAAGIGQFLSKDLVIACFEHGPHRFDLAELMETVKRQAWEAGRLAEREACMKAVCYGCRQDYPLTFNNKHDDGVNVFDCRANGIRELNDKEAQELKQG